MRHRRWLEMAASEPSFPLEPAERIVLDEHLAGCAGCSKAVVQIRRDMHRVQEFAAPVPLRFGGEVMKAQMLRQGDKRTSVRLVIVFALLLAAILSVTASIAFLGGSRPFRPYTVEWSIPTTALRAAWVSIETNGRTFVPPSDVEVTGDAGSLEEWSLDAQWVQFGEGQRLLVEFAADGTDWWVTGIEAYDGTANREWIRFEPMAEIGERLGVPWQGRIDLTGRGPQGEARLRIEDLLLSVSPQISYAAPPGGGRAVPDNIDPLAPGGALAGTNILRLSPAEAHQQLLDLGFRVSWRYAVDQRHYRCFNPPPGTISQESGVLVGGSGEVILVVIPDGSGIPADCD